MSHNSFPPLPGQIFSTHVIRDLLPNILHGVMGFCRGIPPPLWHLKVFILNYQASESV